MELEQVKAYTEQDMYNIFKQGYMMGLRMLKEIPYTDMFGEGMRKMIEAKTGLRPATALDFSVLVSKFYGQEFSDIEGKHTRMTRVNTALKYTCFLCYWFTNSSVIDIGGIVNRNHATILHHSYDVCDVADVDKTVREEVNQLINFVGTEGYYLNKTKRVTKRNFPKWIKY